MNALAALFSSPLPLFRIVLLLILTCLRGKGQNLVPNPGFEKNMSSPCGFIGLTKQRTPDNISNYVLDWYAPTSGTTDYWFFSDSLPRYRNGNDCALTVLDGGQPAKAHTGNGYIGLYATNSIPGAVNFQPNYREYAQVKLTQPLKAKFYYHVSFFAQIIYNAAYCINRLGALFSPLPVTRPLVVDSLHFGEPLLYSPQLLSNQAICQPHQWVEVSSCFQATGGEQYLTIGNFFDDAHTDQQKTNIPFPGGLGTAYYLIDDVTVEEVGGPGYLPQANFLGPDTTLCPGQQLRVSISFAGGSISWPGGDTSRTILADQTGIYMASIRVGQCTVSDTLQVSIVPKLTLIPDTTLCREDILTLSIPGGIGQLRWEDATTSSTRRISQTGIYWVEAINHQCSQSDTIKVRVIDCPGAVPNVITPNGDGKNDRFVIENITLTPWELTIYNRYGSLIYHTNRYHNEWDASDEPVGLYYYLLKEVSSGKQLKGWLQVLR